MEFFFFFFFFLSIFLVLLQTSHSATVMIDGVTHWPNSTASIGDTIIFSHKYHYNLYIFRSRDAFNVCNFTQAYPLSNLNSTTYTWHPSRPGYFYFSFYNGTNTPCQEGQKLAVQVTSQPLPENPANPPEIPPPSTPGGVVSSSPAYPWPFQPREKAVGGGISPAPAMSPLMTGNGESKPFINSNPAVPLPTGEVDSATIRPFPTSADHASQGAKLVWLNEGSILISLCCVIMLMV